MSGRERPIEWMGSTLDDLRDCPEDVKDTLGYALDLAQQGARHPDATPMRGSLRDVTEVVANEDGDTYRCMYPVKLTDAIYVLHVFQKKSTHGIKTPQRHLDLIGARLRLARAHHALHYATPGTPRSFRRREP